MGSNPIVGSIFIRENLGIIGPILVTGSEKYRNIYKILIFQSFVFATR